MVDMDTGYVGVLTVPGKSSDNFMVRSTSSFVEKLRAEKTRLRYDNEPAMMQFTEKIATFRHPRTTILEPINRAEHQSVGGVKRAHSCENRGGHCAWTRTLPVDAETCSVGAKSIPASKVVEAVPLGKSGRAGAARVLCFLSWRRAW